MTSMDGSMRTPMQQNKYKAMWSLFFVSMVILGGCRRVALPIAGQRQKDSAAEITLRWVPGGTFTMGAPEGQIHRHADEVEHQVTVDGFWVSETEFTQAQLARWMDEERLHRIQRRCDTFDNLSLVGNRFAAVCIRWWDAVRLANAVSRHVGLEPAYIIDRGRVEWDTSATGYRLLTEAEWEYAARGGHPTHIYAGTSTDTDLCRFANIADISTAEEMQRDWSPPLSTECDDGYASLAPVGSKRPNAFGLYDMSGSVKEWVWDKYGPYPEHAVINPRGPDHGTERVARGCHWLCAAPPNRVARRFPTPPGKRHFTLGFRLARNR